MTTAQDSTAMDVVEITALRTLAASHEFDGRLMTAQALLKYADLLERLRATPAPEWRDIETAPKDGTRVIVWEPVFRSMEVTRWIGEPHNHWSIDGFRHVTKPTHWQPLPAPPLAAFSSDRAPAESRRE